MKKYKGETGKLYKIGAIILCSNCSKELSQTEFLDNEGMCDRCLEEYFKAHPEEKNI